MLPHHIICLDPPFLTGSDKLSTRDSIGVGYVGVEVVRGCNQVKHEGGLVWAKKKPKTEPWRVSFG